jgi:hypothetical protein
MESAQIPEWNENQTRRNGASFRVVSVPDTVTIRSADAPYLPQHLLLVYVEGRMSWSFVKLSCFSKKIA